MKRALSFFAFAFLVACASDEASYCDNVGNCTQAGDTTWIQSCNDELATLSTEAVASGCTPELDAYFACTSAHFDCEGITATFPTCDAAHAALDACIANAQVGTACAALAAATASCGDEPTATARVQRVARLPSAVLLAERREPMRSARRRARERHVVRLRLPAVRPARTTNPNLEVRFTNLRFAPTSRSRPSSPRFPPATTRPPRRL